MTAAVVVLGLLAAGNGPVVEAAEPGSVRSLREVTEQYRSDREDAVATVALWTQREVEAATQGLLEAVDAAKAAALAGQATREEVAQAEATLPAAPDGSCRRPPGWLRPHAPPRPSRVSRDASTSSRG